MAYLVIKKPFSHEFTRINTNQKQVRRKAPQKKSLKPTS